MTLRYALRSLARSPGFVTVAVVALGVGLGLSTTMFAVLDAVTHPYVAYRDPETLFSVSWWFGRRNPMRPIELFRFIRDNTHSFSAVIPEERWGQVTLHAPSGDQEIGVTRVPPGYFPVTGVRVARGRPFVASDGGDVAIVSHDLWRRMFGTRRDPANTSIALGDRNYAVVGVMPAGATGTWVWLPSSDSSDANRVVWTNIRPVVRLRPGVTREMAANELKRLAGVLTVRFDAQEAPFAFELVPTVSPREELRDLQKAMIGAALVVLLIACVNLAHLMLARGMAKRRELALRLALGASRAAVVRQMLLECAIITLGGSVLGVIVTIWSADVLANRMPPEVSWVGLVEPQLSWRVFAGAAVAAAVSALLFGLVPALRVVMRIDLNEPLKDGSTTTSRVRQRYSPLVVVEVALALVLLMGGGLLLRTLWQLQADARAWDTSRLLRVWVMSRRWDDSTAVPIRWQEVLNSVTGTPGVTAVAIENRLQPKGLMVTAEMVGGDLTRVLNRMSVPVVSADYFSVVRLPILQGRDFQPGDAVGDGAVIIDPLAADVLYPRQNPIGRMLKLGAPATNAPWVRIVGVARNPQALEGADVYREPQVWIAQASRSERGGLIVRTERPDPSVAVVVRRRLASVPGVGGSYVQSFSYGREARLASRAFLANVFVAMGAVALALAALGLYGVLAYAVNQRMREFAVRIALGAQPSRLFRMVLHDGAVMLLAGTGLGAFAALAATRWVDAVIEGVYRTDVWSLIMAEAVLLIIGMAASLAPALRAIKANPMDILRAV